MPAKSCMVCGRPAKYDNRCARHRKRKTWYDGDWPEISRQRRRMFPICENPGCSRSSEEVDHIIARSMAGGIQALCKPCHRHKTQHGELPDMTKPPPQS